jgi:squalene-associated FAD-dependent desaturase
VLEASPACGGRARSVSGRAPDGSTVLLDNGQHILIGAYTESLKMMQLLGVDLESAFVRLPLTLRFPDGDGLALPRWPGRLGLLGGILGARGWSATDKLAVLKMARQWESSGYQCDAQTTVSELFKDLPRRVVESFFEPLCVSALNTPIQRASAQVFLTVLRDALAAGAGSSDLMLPALPLSATLPDAATQWLQSRGVTVELGKRVRQLRSVGQAWALDDESFDAVIWATDLRQAIRCFAGAAAAAPTEVAERLIAWVATSHGLGFEAIATVYAFARGATLAQPLLALRSAGADAPAQFVFDRGRLGGPAGLLAFVVSASCGSREELQAAVLEQGRRQLGLHLQPVQTIVEKHAGFACTAGVVRPGMAIAPGLFVCGDYIAGPYPATLEAAVRSGQAAALALAPDKNGNFPDAPGTT